MALEPYDPCPCGNGKKFKFCCQPIIDDLAALERLIDEGQPKQALLAVEKLEVKHATNPIVLRNKIVALLTLGRKEEALATIHKCQQANPDDPYGYYFDIRWHLDFEGFQAARPLIEKHLFSIAKRHINLACQLTLELVDDLLDGGYYIAVWRHLFNAFRWARSEETVRYVVGMYQELNRTTDIPLPFRNVYQLHELPENQPNQAEFLEAMKLASELHFNQAAQLFEALTEKDPHQPVLSYNAGICYSCSGDLAAAAELLGRAADDLPDFEAAVELETLAQLHDQLLPEQMVRLPRYRYKVQSVSRLLSNLDRDPRLVRQPNPPQPEDAVRSLAALYLVVDRPKESGDVADLNSLPVSIGTVLVLDESREPAEPAEMDLRALVPGFSDADHDLILRAAEDQLDLTSGEGWGKLELDDNVPRDASRLNFNVLPPSGLRRSHLLKFMDDYARHVVYEQWTRQPLESLDGQTPLDAARDPELHLQVCAAINVLAAISDKNGYSLQVDELRKHLGLPPVELMNCASIDELSQLDIQKIVRLDMNDVPAEVIAAAFANLAATRALYPLRRILAAIYDRGIEVPKMDSATLCRMASGLAIQSLDLADAQTWCDRGRELSIQGGADLVQRASWDLLNLELALAANNEEKVVEILRHCAHNYLLKLPQLKQQIAQLLQAEHFDNPRTLGVLNGNDLVTVGAGVGDGGGLWTPESAGAASAGKLWLPGQE